MELKDKIAQSLSQTMGASVVVKSFEREEHPEIGPVFAVDAVVSYAGRSYGMGNLIVPVEDVED